jgi:hypothetical protein
MRAERWPFAWLFAFPAADAAGHSARSTPSNEPAAASKRPIRIRLGPSTTPPPKRITPPPQPPEIPGPTRPAARQHTDSAGETDSSGETRRSPARARYDRSGAHDARCRTSPMLDIARKRLFFLLAFPLPLSTWLEGGRPPRASALNGGTRSPRECGCRGRRRAGGVKRRLDADRPVTSCLQSTFRDALREARKRGDVYGVRMLVYEIRRPPP